MKLLVVIGLLLFVSSSYTAKVYHVSSSSGSYKLSYWQAHQSCEALGGHLATKAELEELRQTNFSYCACGWTLDKTAWFPMTTTVYDCGNAPGLHQCTWQSTWDAWCYEGDSVGDCSRALGVESGAIHPSQMYASSEFHSWYPIFSASTWTAQLAQLHNTDVVNAWIPKRHNRLEEYLEIDLEEPTAVTGILTQGASRLNVKMWVTEYIIKFSKDGFNYRTVQEGEKDKVFKGNTNNNGLKRNMFPEPVLARYIRVYPMKFHNRIALRIELLGCNMKVYEAAQAISRDMVVTSAGGEEKPPVDDIFLDSGN